MSGEAGRLYVGPLSVGGLDLHVERRGSGGPVVVFLHGGAIASGVWEAQFTWFARRTTVVRFDLPGDGRSEFAGQSFSGVEIVRELLSQLEIDRACLVGLSGGARIAIDYALTDPERVERLVAVSPGLSGYLRWSLPEQQAARLKQAIAAGDRTLAAEAWLDLWGPATRDKLLPLASANAESLFRDVRLLDAEPPALGRLAALTAPILVVLGENDLTDIHTIGELIVAEAPSARRAVIAGGDHYPNVHDPEAFNDLVASFLLPASS